MRNETSLSRFAALWLTALLAVGCGDSKSVTNPNPDHEDASTADATSDRATPSEDRPPVQPDASVTNDASDEDASIPPTDTSTSPDTSTAPPMCPMGTIATAGEHCIRPLPPGMPETECTIAARVCDPASVTIVPSTGGGNPGSIECRIGADGRMYMNMRATMPGHGFMTCIGNMTFDYRGPSEATQGILWTDAPCAGQPKEWAPGLTPNASNGTDLTTASAILCQ